jgi:hypothetical protein
MELGLHVADFLWRGGGTSAKARTLARLAHDAEAVGATRLSMMDHVWQIRAMGQPEDEMHEAYTTLRFPAAHTEWGDFRRVQSRYNSDNAAVNATLLSRCARSRKGVAPRSGG